MGLDVILGGDNPETQLLDADPKLGKGVYARYIGKTPRYHTGNNTASIARQARLFVEFPDHEAWLEYASKVPDYAGNLLRVLSPQSRQDNGGIGFVDFILSRVSQRDQEKLQISQVLSDGFVAYFFGKQPPTWQLTGTLMNTLQDPWYDSFHILYDQVIRGTKLSRIGVPLKLSYDNRIVVGALTAMNTTLNGDMEMGVQFNATFLVKRVYFKQLDTLQPPTDLAKNGFGAYDIRSDKAERLFTSVFTDLNDARKFQDVGSSETFQSQLSVDAVRAGADRQSLLDRAKENDLGSGLIELGSRLAQAYTGGGGSTTKAGYNSAGSRSSTESSAAYSEDPTYSEERKNFTPADIPE